MPFGASLLFPQENACHMCGRFQDTGGVVCLPCIRKLNRLRLKKGPNQSLPVLGGSISVYRHQGIARRMVHQLKYRNDPAVAPFMGLQMAAALGGLALDLVLPVPLHRDREAARGYNQAALLAQAVCLHTGLPYDDSVLLRVRSTDSQARRSRQERLMAMQNAFQAAVPDRIADRRILLVDDVVTTGATAIACAEELLHKGAREVYLLTFCHA